MSAATINETIGTLPEADRAELERLLNAFTVSISAALDAQRAPHGGAAQTADGDRPSAHASRVPA